MAKYLSHKQVAKRIKAKGLGQLRFFCQPCGKQCRDANGFKCHCESESHLRNMQLFAANPEKVLAEYSASFESAFLELLRRRWRSKAVYCNDVYNEYIQDKEHVHMNGTRWETLSSFVRYLGEAGKVEVTERERGLYIKWIEVGKGAQSGPGWTGKDGC